jgi:hypothetical protein
MYLEKINYGDLMVDGNSFMFVSWANPGILGCSCPTKGKISISPLSIWGLQRVALHCIFYFLPILFCILMISFAVMYYSFLGRTPHHLLSLSLSLTHTYAPKIVNEWCMIY